MNLLHFSHSGLHRCLRGITCLLLLVSGMASAATINALWYTYADPASEYRTTGIPGIAARASTYPQSGGQSWNVSFFDMNSPTPDFAAYDVLVIESGEAFRTNPPGGAYATPNFSGILNNSAAISAARGDRTIISATDADFHAIRGDTGLCDPFSGCGYWDGALGYLINMVDWAASGNGLGVVALLDGEFPGSYWWTNTNSFLHNELADHVSYFRENNPIIPDATADYPLNTGLTSAGLSNWSNSFHAGFDNVPGYTGLIYSSAHPALAVSIATSAFADAPTSGQIPEPTSALLVVTAIALLAHRHRKTVLPPPACRA